jgi:hypothetical protein
MLAGEQGIGKTTICKQVIADFCKLHNLKLEELINRDIHFYENKTSVAEIREIRTKASQPPFRSPIKWILFKNIENYGVESLNALLKILEESPVFTKFLITTCDDTKVLQTIRGRCSIFNLYPLSNMEIQAYLVTQGVTADKAALLAQLSCGSIQLAKQFQSKVDMMDIVRAIISWFQNMNITNLETIWTDIDYLFKNFDREIIYQIFLMLLADIWHMTIENKTHNPMLQQFDISKTRFLLKRGFSYIYDRVRYLADTNHINDTTQLKSLFLEIIGVGK